MTPEVTNDGRPNPAYNPALMRAMNSHTGGDYTNYILITPLGK